VATLKDANPGATASDFTASVNWGDGTTSAGTVAGSFTISASHAYAANGSFQISVTVTDDGGSTLSATGPTVAIVLPALAAAPGDVVGTGEVVTNAQVAAFTDPNAADTASQVSATINWGDGATSAGTVSGGAGRFDVLGSHTYASRGLYALRVVVSEPWTGVLLPAWGGGCQCVATWVVADQTTPLKAKPDFYGIDPNAAKLVIKAPGVLANDENVAPGAKVTLLAGKGPSFGKVDLNTDGSFTYTPKIKGAAQVDHFWYQVRNPDGQTSSAQVSIGTSFGGYVDYTDSPLSSSGGTGTTGGGVVMQGGGDYVIDSLKWFIEHARAGNVVILTGIGGGDKLAVLLRQVAKANNLRLGTIDTIEFNDENLPVGRAEANSPRIAMLIGDANGVYITGGDQYKYLEMWYPWVPLANSYVTTKVREAINNDEIVHNQGVIGGTSAGMHILPDVVYRTNGAKANLTSPEADGNPYDPRMIFLRDFIKPTTPPGQLLADTTTDTHFHERDRMGRTIAFLARMRKGTGPERLGPLTTALGVAADEEAAVALETLGSDAGLGKVMTNPGDRAVYFLSAPTHVLAERALVWPGAPLTYETVGRYRVRDGGTVIFGNDRWSYVRQGKNQVYPIPVWVYAGVVHPTDPYA
jgi:cyanophycinase-like exopeptidase